MEFTGEKMKSVSLKVILLAVGTTLLAGTSAAIASVSFLYQNSQHNLELLGTSLRDDYDRNILHTVQVAHAALQDLVRQRDEGLLSDADARTRGANLLRNLKYGTDSYFWADTYEGRNVVYLGSESEGTVRWDLQDASGKFFIQEIIAAGRAGGGFVDYSFPRPGQTEALPKRSYALAFEPFGWVLGTGNYIDDIQTALGGYQTQAQERLAANAAVLLAILTLGIALAAGLAVLMGRRIVLPLREISRALEELSHGDADLTATLPVRTKDEIGRLGSAFNVFAGNLRSLLTTVKSSMDALGRSGADLSANATETAAATHQITSNIQSVGHMVITQSASITETSATVEEIGKTFQSFRRMIETQASEVQKSTQSLETMVVDVETLVTQVEEASEVFRVLQSDSSQGSKTMEAVSAAVARITAQSENLQETNQAITSVASQTNLLAMNAAIEAAHAGEAGRGFAVVADEVRKLAETASKQATESKRVLQDIQQVITEVRQASAQAGDVFAAISQQVPRVVSLQAHLQETLKVQAGENRKVLAMFQAIERLSVEIREGSGEMEQGTQTILEEMNRLVRISQEVQASMAEIAHGTEEINTAIHAISTLTVGTKESIDAVDQLTQRFKLEKTASRTTEPSA